ncbi:uncharacterized protein [Aegilops tauschii subsp. strangulata]|uniref:uncharacterized protein n=1 Tax=Aegilops tauschii subsp. strangulata TaxID=200361 RepID=UPI003CC88647
MRMYATVHNNAAKREKWSRVKYEVNMTQGQTEFTCECGYFEHTGMLCSHVSRVIDILHLKEIPAKHIVKRCTKDARGILPKLLALDGSTLYLKAMEVVRMGGASAESFDHMFGGLEALLVSGAPLAEKRAGLGFEDRMAGLTPGTLPDNGEIAYVEDRGADQCISAGNSVGVNALHGLTAPEKQRWSVDQQIAGRRQHTRV